MRIASLSQAQKTRKQMWRVLLLLSPCFRNHSASEVESDFRTKRDLLNNDKKSQTESEFYCTFLLSHKIQSTAQYCFSDGFLLIICDSNFFAFLLPFVEKPNHQPSNLQFRKIAIWLSIKYAKIMPFSLVLRRFLVFARREMKTSK